MDLPNNNRFVPTQSNNNKWDDIYTSILLFTIGVLSLFQSVTIFFYWSKGKGITIDATTNLGIISIIVCLVAVVSLLWKAYIIIVSKERREELGEKLANILDQNAVEPNDYPIIVAPGQSRDFFKKNIETGPVRPIRNF